jgi:hypothetical protein
MQDLTKGGVPSRTLHQRQPQQARAIMFGFQHRDRPPRAVLGLAGRIRQRSRVADIAQRCDSYEPKARGVGVMRSDSGHKSEGDNKELIAAVIADVQDPVAPILEAARLSETAHDAGRVITCLNEIVYQSAPAIDENLPGVGAVEIHLGHFSASFESVGSYEISASQFSARDRREDRRSDAVRIWNHIQVVIRGKRIIYAPRGLPFAGEIVRFDRRSSPPGR